MRKAVIRFECGFVAKEWEDSFYCPENELRRRANRILQILAKYWNIPKENIKVEIRYVIKLK